MEDIGQAAGFSAGLIVVWLIFTAFYMFIGWKIYEKAGKPGWTSLIPIYNTIIILEIIKKPLWWLILLFIPFVNIIISFILSLELAKVFGKSSGFGVGLFFLGFIFAPILAFDDSQYIG